MNWFSIWVIPIFSATIWVSMLLAMFLWWTESGSPHFSSMAKSQTIAYISDVGAQDLKPLFITMSTVTVVSFDAVFIIQRWLRHTGKLTANASWVGKVFNVLATIFAVAGGAGLILLSIFDTLHHPRLHDVFLAVFIAGYVFAAVFVCLEFWRLERHNRDTPILRVSFYMKLAFIVTEVALAIAFGITQHIDKWNASAVIEWVIALIYTFFVLSFVVDFFPSARTGTFHEGLEKGTGMPPLAAPARGVRFYRRG